MDSPPFCAVVLVCMPLGLSVCDVLPVALSLPNELLPLALVDGEPEAFEDDGVADSDDGGGVMVSLEFTAPPEGCELGGAVPVGVGDAGMFDVTPEDC